MLGAMVALTIVGTLIANGLLTLMGALPRGRWPQFVGSLAVALGDLALVIGTAVTVYQVVRSGSSERTALALRTKERDEAEAQRLAAEAQLASLESRVQPHFLFNTLNSIAALIPQDPAGAERMTEQLASLMRSALDGGSRAARPARAGAAQWSATTSTSNTSASSDRLRYRIEADPSDAATSVPRLSLQTLVENSVKFAVSPRREGGSISRHAPTAVGLPRHGSPSRDDGPGFDPPPRPGPPRPGAAARAAVGCSSASDASLDDRQPAQAIPRSCWSRCPDDSRLHPGRRAAGGASG